MNVALLAAAGGLVMLLATPVLAMTVLLVAMERFMGVGIFDPARGGDPILFQHMFWFYSHPAVYIMILPAMGVVSALTTCFARRPIFGYTGMTYALMAIAIISFFVWGHHMFTAGISIYSAVVFSLMTFFVAVPAAIKVFNCTASLHKGSITFDAPMLYAFGFVLLFTIGGLTGLIVATVALDVHLQRNGPSRMSRRRQYLHAPLLHNISRIADGLRRAGRFLRFAVSINQRQQTGRCSRNW
jgi:cytochrome c oxidase subunit I